MKIITGDEFGLIKLISTENKKVIDQYGTMDSSKSIINIFSNYKIKDNNKRENNSEEIEDEEEEHEEIEEIEENLKLYVTSLHENYILDWYNKNIISSYNNENNDISFISSTIKFPSNDSNNTIFINGTSDSHINIVNFNEENKYKDSSIYMPVDTSNKNLKIKLSGVSDSIYNKDSVYLLYRNTPLVLYNIEEKKIEFKGKNLPNDELNLKIPIHDTDIVEVKNNPRLNYVSTAFGEIRLYDKKASPRPSLNKKVTSSKINQIDITADNNYLFIGDNLGYCAMLDIRKNLNPCKTFKGNTGAIKTIVNIEQNKNLIVGGFDRYIRWYDYESGGRDEVFVKNKVNVATLVGYKKSKNEDFEDEEEGEIDDSELLEEESEEENNEENGEESDEQKNKGNNNKENGKNINEEGKEYDDEDNEDEGEEENDNEDNDEEGEEEDDNEDNDEEGKEENDNENNDDEGEEENDNEDIEEENGEQEDDESNEKENKRKNEGEEEENDEENDEDGEEENDENDENEGEENDENEGDENEEESIQNKEKERSEEDDSDKNGVSSSPKSDEKEQEEQEEQNEDDNEEEDEEDLNEEEEEDNDANEEEEEDNDANEEEDEENHEEEDEDGEESEQLNKKRKREKGNNISNNNQNKRKKLF